jgi:hypothetical protein
MQYPVMILAVLIIWLIILSYKTFKKGAPTGEQFMVVDGKVVIANQLRLVDGKGVVRGNFGINNHGDPALSLYDAQGNPRGIFTVTSDDSTGILFYDNKGINRARLSLGVLVQREMEYRRFF